MRQVCQGNEPCVYIILQETREIVISPVFWMAIANKWKRPSSIGGKEETEIEVVVAVERQADP
jgi:hypothetical protein